MAKAIGIDFGETHAVIAVCRKVPAVIQNRENQDLTPSVVGLHKGEVIAGSVAMDRIRLAPKDTIIAIRRLMGRAFNDDEVQKVRGSGRYLYDIVEPADGTDDDVRVMLGGRQYSPVEISARILRKLKEDAELRESDTIDAAVITVPAYFTDKQRNATRLAGQMAGLRVQKIIDEPTAAAYAFGVDSTNPDDAKNLLVYDLGGGTFDVSVLTVVGGTFAQLAIEGDMWFGGDDFDFHIVDHVVEHVKNVYEVDARTQPAFMAELKKRSQQAKETLSTLTKTDIMIAGVLKAPDGNVIDIDMELTRADFERMIAKDVRRSIEKVREALQGAGITAQEVDHVLLVGGSSTIPLVRKMLAEVFDASKIMMNVDPMHCVAFGAATLSLKLTTVECPKGHVNPMSSERCEHDGCGLPLVAPPAGAGGDFINVTASAYGIETDDDKFVVIIRKGTPYPMQEPAVFRVETPAANLRRMRIPLYADAGGRKELQATIWLELPEGVAGRAPLDVAFILDDNGILEKVKVSLKDGSGTEVETFLDRGDNERSQIEKKLEQLWGRQRDLGVGLHPETERALRRMYEEALGALTSGQIDMAEALAQGLEDLVGRAAEAAARGWPVALT